MEIAPRKYYIGMRVSFAFIFALLEFFFALMIVGELQESGAFLLKLLFALIGQLVLLCFFLWLLCWKPWVKLTDERIYVQIIWKIKEYQWKDIPQIGILDWHMDGRSTEDLVILLPGGVPRKPYDMFVRIKNVGRLIHIPNTPAVRACIAEYYGPLDFDMFDGKPET